MTGVSLSVALLALALLTGCNSNNPDALNGANLDVNPAVADANAMANGDSNADLAGVEESTVVASAEEPAGNEVTNTAQANIDAAVNSLREIDAEQNAVDEAEGEFNGDDDDSDGY